MSDQSNRPNGGAEPQRQSLRDVAESVYDDLVETAENEAGEEDSGQEAQPRDNRGRFVSKDAEPGEAAEAEPPPSPDEEVQSQEPDQEHPAPETGEAAQPPANWSAEDRATFQKLPREGQEFLLRRHSEMESDYQKRVQATAFSNQFMQAVAPVFNDPDIAESLRQSGRSPIEAVYQRGGYHKRAMSPDLRTRVELLFDLASQMQIDPAAVFGLSATPVNPLFTPEQLNDPGIKRFADHLGQTSTRIQTLEAEIQRMHQAERDRLTGTKRVEIDAFADQRNADGSPLHPYFDHFLPIIMEHYAANPGSTIEQSYHAAVQPILGSITAQANAKRDQQQSVQRAQQAVRSNTRGMTAPVSKPAPPEGKRGLRQILEESAEEVGM